jgi:hypothetical protein
VAWKISFHRVENVGQGSGIIIDLIFPLYGLENKFQCPGIYIFMPETDKFRAILTLQVVFFAVYWTSLPRLVISRTSLFQYFYWFNKLYISYPL